MFLSTLVMYSLHCPFTLIALVSAIVSHLFDQSSWQSVLLLRCSTSIIRTATSFYNCMNGSVMKASLRLNEMFSGHLSHIHS